MLKDQLTQDLDIFMNTDEFATKHKVNGIEIPIIIDEELLKERQSRVDDPAEGVYDTGVLLVVKKVDYGEKPAIGEIVKLDEDIYRVQDVQNDEGMYIIELVANDS